VGGSTFIRIDPRGLNPEEGVGYPPPGRNDGNEWGWGCGDKGTDAYVPDGFGSADFTPACRKHDDCYGTCGNKKAMCDQNFRNDLMTQCAKAGNGWLCRKVAAGYSKAMQTKTSEKAYKAAQEEACCKK
jgi:hypothetical protein